MVRLVFRPYTQVKRTICTSVSLRASTIVSSGFPPLRNSSPSFESRRLCSTRTLLTRLWWPTVHPFIEARGSRQSVSLRLPGFRARRLARTSNSSVQVSRRVRSRARRLSPKARGCPKTARAASPGGRRCHLLGEHFAKAYAAAATPDGPRPEPSGEPASAVLHPAGAHRRPPSASLPTISSTLWLSFQSPFHLSPAVLIRYQSLARISPWTKFAAWLGLHSQTTRLADGASCCATVWARKGSHPLQRPLQGDLRLVCHWGRLYRLQFGGWSPPILKLGTTRFAHRY